MTSTEVTQSVEVTEDDIVWSRVGELELRAHIYRPASIGAAGTTAPSVLVEVHGGAWNTGDRMNSAYANRGIAGGGTTVVAIDFRQGPQFQHPTGSADAVGAVRWVRSRPELWGGAPRSVGLIGSSSGGHLALLAATTPDAPEHRGSASIGVDGSFRARDEVDGSVDYVIGLYPVSDPHVRYRYAKRARLESLVERSEAYFGSEETMRAASVPRIVVAGEATRLPPALIVQPGEDANVPVEMTFELLRAWQGRAGYIEYAHFPGLPHGFTSSASAETDAAVRLVRAFIARHDGRG